MANFKRYLKADLVVPSGINVDRVAQLVANQVALTIIHEAAHGARWAEEYYTRKKDLSTMNRSEEESIAEQAEEKANLTTELSNEIFDANATAQKLSNQEILQRAISIANTQNEFQIPPDSVEDVRLGPDRWGQFQMIQSPGMKAVEPTRHPHIAWNEEKRKLQIDVESIVAEYNKAISPTNSPSTKPTNYQDSGIEAPYPGVSRQPPTEQSSSAYPSGQSVPSISGRASMDQEIMIKISELLDRAEECCEHKNINEHENEISISLNNILLSFGKVKFFKRLI